MSAAWSARPGFSAISPPSKTASRWTGRPIRPASNPRSPRSSSARPRRASISSATASSASPEAGRSTPWTGFRVSRSATWTWRAASAATRRSFPNSMPNISRPRICRGAGRPSRSARSAIPEKPRSSRTSTTSKPRSGGERSSADSCPWLPRRARCRGSRTNITARKRSSSLRWPRPCTRNMPRSSRPGFSSRSTTRSCPICTTWASARST